MSRTDGRRVVGTDRHLVALVGLIVVLASAVTAAAVSFLVRQPPTAVRDIATLITLIFMITVGGIVKTSVRIRSTTHSIAWVETAVVIGVAIAPSSWVILSTGVGVAAASAILRLPAIKTAFGIGKNVLIAGGTVVIARFLDWPSASPSVGGLIGVLGIVYLVAALLDDILAIPVIALASGTPISRQFRSDLDLRVAGFGVRFVVAACTCSSSGPTLDCCSPYHRWCSACTWRTQPASAAAPSSRPGNGLPGPPTRSTWSTSTRC